MRLVVAARGGNAYTHDCQQRSKACNWETHLGLLDTVVAASVVERDAVTQRSAKVGPSETDAAQLVEDLAQDENQVIALTFQ